MTVVVAGIAAPPADIASQLAGARAVLDRHLGDGLLALHLFGSAIDGGLRPHSDIDLMVSTSAPLADPVRRSLMVDLLSVSAPPGAPDGLRPLEVTVLVRDEVVPWRYPARRELQFGEWLRDDLRAGRVETAVPDPDLAILLTQLRQRSVALLGPSADVLFEAVPRADFLQALRDTVAQWNGEADWRGDERNIVLALARVWFSWVTGGIAPKDVAADWVIPRLPPALQPLLAQARLAYLGEARDDPMALAAGMAAYVRHVRCEVEAA